MFIIGHTPAFYMGDPRFKFKLRKQLLCLSFFTYQSAHINAQGLWLMHNRTELSHIYFIALERDRVCVPSESKVTIDLLF